MELLSGVKVKPSIRATDVVVQDLLRTKFDVIACDDVLE